MMKLIIFGVAATLLQASAYAQLEEEIIGYRLVCETSILTTGGKLTGRRQIDESTKRMVDSDYATWEQDVHNRLNSLNIVWHSFNSAANLTKVRGVASIYVRTERRLPKVGTWAAQQVGSPLPSELLLPIIRAADTKFGSVTIPIEPLVAFVGQADKLKWKVLDPRPDRDGWKKTYAEGEIDVIGIREGFQAIPRLGQALDAMITEPEKKCVRTPEYDNAAAEI